MKRVPLLILALTLCFVAASTKNAEAGLACSATYKTTPTFSGYGTSCSQSENSLYNTAAGYINCGDYGTCYEELMITAGCRISGTSYRTDGYIRYRCYYCASQPCPI